MTNKNVLLISLLLFANQVFSQFFDSVRIVFEKKINVHKIYEKTEWMKSRIKYTDKYQVELYEFSGNVCNSSYRFYEANEDESTPRSFIMGYSAFDNVVYHDYKAKTARIYKVIYEDKALIIDSLRSFRWKITDETRDIAGYRCRKATTTIFDSLTVYAFYAQEIKISGGPETFNGLPGMILGVAVPQMHTTWFAQSVDTASVYRFPVIVPEKGKKTDYQSLFKKVNDALKDWGNTYSQLMIWFNLI